MIEGLAFTKVIIVPLFTIGSIQHKYFGCAYLQPPPANFHIKLLQVHRLVLDGKLEDVCYFDRQKTNGK